ncbi:ABC transporter permease [Chloroflexota bacterium]
MRDLWVVFRKNKIAIVGLFIAIVIILMAILSPFIAPYDPLLQNISDRLSAPQAKYLLGTDDFGRDILSRIIYGSQASLLIGVLAIALAVIFGTLLGIFAGFKGGKLETAIMRGADVLMSFPSLILGLFVMAILGTGLIKVILAIGFVFLPRVIRVAHGPTLSIKEREFIDAARAMGLSNWRIVIKHILPNVFGELLVMGTLWIGTAIRIEASLSFLGLGVPPPTPTWGNMIKQGLDFLANAPWISISAGIAVLVTILAFNMLGDGVRDITDPKLQQ